MAALTGSIIAASIVVAPDGTEHMQLVIDIDASGDTLAQVEAAALGRATRTSPRTPTDCIGVGITVTTTTNAMTGIALT